MPGLEYGLLMPVRVADVDPDEMEADREVAEDPEAVLLDALQDILRDLVEGLDVAGLESRGGSDVAGLRGEDDLVEMDVLLVVVVRRPDHGHALARNVALEHKRPDADRVVAEVRAEIGELHRRHDPLVHEAEAERNVGCRQVQHHVVGPVGGDGGARPEDLCARGAWKRDVALERGGDSGRIERGAVVEEDPLPERDRHRQLVLRDGRGLGGEQRNDVSGRIVVVQRLADRAQDLTRRELRVAVGIEGRRSAGGEADVQRSSVLDHRRLRRAGSGGQREQRDRRCREQSHCATRPVHGL